MSMGDGVAEPFNVLAVRDVSKLSDEQFSHAVAEVLRMQRADRQENQILYYKPTQPNSLKIMQSDARLLGVGGGNRCLPLSAPVLMADGSWRALGDIAVGDMVMGADPSSGRCAPSAVTEI